MNLIINFASFCLTRLLLPKLLYLIVPLHHAMYFSSLVGVKLNFGSFLPRQVVVVIAI